MYIRIAVENIFNRSCHQRIPTEDFFNKIGVKRKNV